MKAPVLTRRVSIVAAVLFVSLGIAQGKTIYVDDDGVADFATIKAAVAAAQSGDVISVATGTYTGSGARDLVLAGKVLTIQSSDPSNPDVVAATVIDCQASDGQGHRFIEITRDTGAELTLAGLKVINAALGHAGGVVLCEGATLRLFDCIFISNSVNWWGGAIYCDDSAATIEGCTFTRNASANMHGGAIYGQNSILTVTDCAFRDNTGNALQTFDSIVTLAHCTFTNNTGREGGAIYSHAALEADVRAFLDVSGCTFAGNSSSTSGGAVANHRLETIITSCSFTANAAAANGGAIYNDLSSPVISNCVFVENTAIDAGGAVANHNESAPEITHATFVANEANYGGAVSSRRNSDPQISHCILWNNQAEKGSALYLGPDPLGVLFTSNATLEYSDLESGQAGTYTGSGCVLTWGPGNLDAAPLFTEKAQHDYRLSADSPCVDAGNPDFIPSAEATDLDGQDRLFGRAVDLGAYEYQGLAPVYRFWRPSQSRYFYTMDEDERDWLIAEYPQVWQFEDIAFYAHLRNLGDNVVPVYRFWSPRWLDHIWTTDERERDRLMKEPADLWSPEGVAFYAYGPGKPPLGTIPVYRFWSATKRYHIFTIDETRKNRLIADSPGVWAYEGIAFFVHGATSQPQQVAYEFSGAAEEAWYAITLAAYIDGQETSVDEPEISFTTASARLGMAINFTDMTATLDEVHVASRRSEHASTIRRASFTGLAIPFSISVQAAFEAQSERGPYAIDDATGIFADYAAAPQSLPADLETFTLNGSVTLGGQALRFDQAIDAKQFLLESSGAFKSLSLLADNVTASLPLTFQWQASDVRNLLAEATVNGRLVQIYVTDLYLATQGAWTGNLTK